MEKRPKRVTRTYQIKNMVCQCCVHLLQEKFESMGIVVENLLLGQATLSYDPVNVTENQIASILSKYGFGIIVGREEQLVEKIKIAVIELIHHMNNVDSIIRKSEYLVEKLGMSYPYLSRIFSSGEGITLEKYIIQQKIERIKELIFQGEYTLSEIAFMMDYSSVQYLSNQFRKITGFSVTEFKNNEIPLKRSLDHPY